MPRVKHGGGGQTPMPSALQDRTGIEGAIFKAIKGLLTPPILDDVDEALDEALRSLVSGVVRSVEVELRPGYRGGHVDVVGVFSNDQVGAPVIVTQAPPSSPDGAEFAIVLFVGQVIDARTLRLHWHCTAGAPRRVTVNYIIGTSRRE